MRKEKGGNGKREENNEKERDGHKQEKNKKKKEKKKAKNLTTLWKFYGNDETKRVKVIDAKAEKNERL